jgi:hypothetical protein
MSSLDKGYAIKKKLVRQLKRKKILKLEGKVEWTDNLDETRKSRI